MIVFKKTILIVIVLGMLGTVFFALPAVAQVQDFGLKITADFAGLPISDATPISIVSRIVNVVLGFLGVLFIVLILYGGFMWMTSSGNEEKITKAKNIIGNSVVGLAIVLASFTISMFIFRNIKKSTSTSPNTPQARLWPVMARGDFVRQ
ncbi:MAG: hypothetical protein V1712_01780 [Patescibacteria group bacterium]